MCFGARYYHNGIGKHGGDYEDVGSSKEGLEGGRVGKANLAGAKGRGRPEAEGRQASRAGQAGGRESCAHGKAQGGCRARSQEEAGGGEAKSRSVQTAARGREAAKGAGKEELYASRADIMREQKEKELSRKAAAAKLESSAAAVKKTQVKDKYAGLFGAKKPEDEWGYGKSKIWLALNPQPLAFQTAEDKREAEEEGANFVGMVGGGSRGFGGNAMGAGAGGGDEAGMMPDEEDGFVDDGALDDADNAERVNEDADFNDDLQEDRGQDEDSESEYEDEYVEEEELGNEDVEDTMKYLKEMRAKRAVEEEKRKAELRAAAAAEKKIRMEEEAKVMAVIIADKELEYKEKMKEQEQVMKESMARMEEEMTFSFSWG